MTAVIIDDEKYSVDALISRLEPFDDIRVKGYAANGRDGLALVRDIMPDVLFLDVELPDISGLDFLECMHRLDGGRCKVVMYTAYDSFMLSAFRGKAFDYLVKPVCDDELDIVVRRLREDLGATFSSELSDEAEVAQLIAGHNRDEGVRQIGSGRFVVYIGMSDFCVIRFDDLCMFSYNSAQRCWNAVVAGHDSAVRLKRGVGSDAILSLDERLCKVSNRHIINLDYLMEVVGSTCRFYPPFDAIKDVQVGRFFRKRLIERLAAI